MYNVVAGAEMLLFLCDSKHVKQTSIDSFSLSKIKVVMNKNNIIAFEFFLLLYGISKFTAYLFKPKFITSTALASNQFQLDNCTQSLVVIAT